MKNQFILIFCLALSLIANASFAQLSKKEQKEWKAKAKEYAKKPAALKQLLEDKQIADDQVATLNQKINQVLASVNTKDAQIAELESQLAQARSQLTTTSAELAQLKSSPTVPQNNMDFSQGVIFKVQIGAFRNKDLSKYFENNPNFGGLAGEDGAQRYTIGVFRDYWEADAFKKYMREMGVKDAWIVPFKDGQRVDIKDVLEGVVNEKTGETTPVEAPPVEAPQETTTPQNQ
jgi:hypothetical protein